MSFNFFINVKCKIGRKCYRTGKKIFAVVHPSNYSQPSLWRTFTEQHIIFSDPNHIHFQNHVCLGGEVGLGDRSHFITLQLPIPHLLASTSQGHFTEEYNYRQSDVAQNPLQVAHRTAAEELTVPEKEEEYLVNPSAFTDPSANTFSAGGL